MRAPEEKQTVSHALQGNTQQVASPVIYTWRRHAVMTTRKGGTEAAPAWDVAAELFVGVKGVCLALSGVGVALVWRRNCC